MLHGRSLWRPFKYQAPDPLIQAGLTIEQSLRELEAYSYSLEEAKYLKDLSERRFGESRALLAIVARAALFPTNDKDSPR